jgi:hypothetical protein
MKKRIAFIALAAALCAGGVISMAAAKPEEPILLKATLFTHTNNEDKDHDTGVFVEVRNADGSSLIGKAYDRDDTNDDGGQYKDNSDHQFDLDLGDAVGMSKSSCHQFQAKIWQQTHNGAGHDTWKFTATLVLTFSDHTNITATKSDISLVSRGTGDRPSVTFSAP